MDTLPPRLILDTNVVLDCLVFDDPAIRELTTAVEARRVQALVHECTIDELQRVLAYPQLSLDEAQRLHVLNRYRAASAPAAVPDGFGRETLLLPPGFPRCRDRDDEVFLALAYHARADALVTWDKAVLKLRRKARRFGVAIVTPADKFQAG